LLTFIAVVALAAALLAVRSSRRSRGERRVSGAGDVADAIRAFRRSGDTAALADALSTVSVSVLLAVIPRTLGELNCREREAFETALARRRFAAYLRENFRGFDETKRVLACELLAVLGGERSVAFLKERMADRAYRVRVAAAIALAQRGELGELSATIAALGKRARRSLRLVQMFAHILPVREADVREFAQTTGEDAFVRVAALRALAAKAGCDDELLLRLSGDASPVVVTAVGALAVEYRFAAAPAVLERMLSSRSPAVRRDAALRAFGMANAELGRSLRNSLQDPDAMVVSAAARTLFAGKRSRPAPAIAAPVPVLFLAAAVDATCDR
jgi:HEAT repeat protein